MTKKDPSVIFNLRKCLPWVMTKVTISIKKIAELAGVSYPTVSRALRNEGRIGEETRKRIVTIAREHGYTPNLTARGLVSKRSGALGLVFTRFSDPFHSDIAQKVEIEANRRGYSLFIASNETQDKERELEIVRSFQGRNVEGIIVSSGREGPRYSQLFRETNIPIVTVNSHAADHIGHSVCHDDYGGGCAIVQHLIKKGYQNIIYLGNGSADKAQSDRLRAWHDVLKKNSFVPAIHIDSPEGRVQDGAAATEQLLSQHSAQLRNMRSASWCFNDAMALGALSVLHRHGFAIPTDIGVAGFDDIDSSAFAIPALTTWHQPRQEMASVAAQMLFGLIEASDSPPADFVMPGWLVVRHST